MKFIREYKLYATTMYDIIYKSGRLRVCTAEELPKTAAKFIAKATPKRQYDKFHGEEIIYEITETS